MKNEILFIPAETDKEICWQFYKSLVKSLVEEKRLSFFAASILIKNIRKSLGMVYPK